MLLSEVFEAIRIGRRSFGSVGISSFSFYIIVIALILILGTLVLMSRDRITSRLALRNITRRKITVLLVIFGLFIGTAMISGSLVTGNTLNNLFTRGAYYSYGAVDESVYYPSAQGGYGFFNYSSYLSVRSSLLQIPNTAGVTPMIISSVSLFDNNTKVGQPGVVLIGADPNSTTVLGSFTNSAGNVIDPNIGINGLILNDAAAKDLNASVGDSIQVLSGTNSSSFTVRGIDTSFDRSGFPGESDHAVITLEAAQELLGKQGMINYIAITNAGGIQHGIAYTQQVGKAANSTLSSISGSQLYAFGEKNQSVSSAAQSAQSFSSIFLTTSSFAIIAGAVLIVNIFVMLAEERKKEMGMARAVGMKRSGLTKLFLFEGTQYAIISSLVGVFAGLAIAYGILYIFGTILLTFIPFLNIGVILQSFTFTPGSLITSFGAGLLITFFTILLASWRVSKLNIIRAIRDIGEPPSPVRTYTKLLFLGVAVSALGVLSYIEGLRVGDPSLFLLGPALVILGIGLVLSRFLKNRYAFTISSLALLIYWGYPRLSWTNPASPAIGNSNFTPFVLGGIFMVVSAVMLVVYNTDVLMEGITRMFRLRTRSIPVLKIGLSYPGNKKFRTGVTIFMFALVMFTVVAVSVLITVNSAAINQAFQTSSGGYDLIAITSTPVHGLDSKIRADSNVSSALRSVATFNGGYTRVKDLSNPDVNSSAMLFVGANASAVGDDNFFHYNQYNMTNATAPFLLSNGKVNIPKVWSDIQSNPKDVVLSNSLFSSFGAPSSSRSRAILPGDTISILLPNRTETNVTVVALMNGIALNGFVSTSSNVLNLMKSNSSQYALMALNNSSQAQSVSISLKRDFLSYGMQVIVLPTLVNQILDSQRSFFTLFQGFLGLGLVVGIAGLSIIAIRAVVERRQEIGMVRALGFTRSMVLGSFLLENSFVALLGILIGALLAIDLGYAIVSSIGFSVPYIVPWLNVIEVSAIAYAFAMLGTMWSALKAARTLPAEALRYVE